MFTLAKLTLENFNPPWFWALVIIASLAILVVTYRGIYQRSGRRLTWLLFGLRVVGVLALLVALVKPAWTRTTEQTERPRLAIVLDDSQSMGISHKGANDVYESRWKHVSRWLNETTAGRELRDKFDVAAFNIAGDELKLNSLPSEPTAEQTDLVRGLRAAAGRLRGQNAAGVVLVSDGRDTTGRDNFLSVREFPLPVFTVGFRQPPVEKSGPYNLSIVSVDAPQRTLVHNSVTVKALVTKDGGDAMDLPVQIERAGTVLKQDKVKLPAGAVPQQLVSLTFTPNEPGDFVMAVRIPEQPNQRSTAGNIKMFKLRVEADPIRVLYIEGFLRPEYTFLHERLSNDPDIDLVTFVRSANPEQATFSGTAAANELITAERLKKIDVVLLGDFETAMLDEPVYKVLKEWVEGGGAVMVLGGYYNLSDTGLARTALGDALPVNINDSPLAQIEQPVKFMLTDEGRRHPALSVTGDMARDAQLWESLAPLKGLVAVKGAKPAATVLARDPRPLPGADDKKGPILLAYQPFGKGTVAVLTADTTWRWSRLARLAGNADTLYVRFWSQMVRWLARRDVRDERPALSISTDAAVYERGQRVAIRVQRNPASMVPGTETEKANISVTIKSPDGRTAQVQPQQSSTDANQWTASYFPDRGGRFTIDARMITGGATTQPSKDIANQVAEFLVRDSALERDDPATSPATLAEISRSTGGVYADIDDAGALKELLEKIPEQPRTLYQVQKASVWNNPILFFVFLACVSVEWIIRRRHQLV